MAVPTPSFESEDQLVRHVTQRPDAEMPPTTVSRMPLAPGAKAPAFNLLDQSGQKVKLSDFKGRKVLVYFYPTPLTNCHI